MLIINDATLTNNLNKALHDSHLLNTLKNPTKSIQAVSQKD